MEPTLAQAARTFEKFTRHLTDAHVIGVDVGTASIKVVQLRRGASMPILETFGEISLGMYEGVEDGKKSTSAPSHHAEALLDLVHEVRASARRGGFAIPLSAALTSVVDMPKRDDEQMRRIVPVEARQYIPLPPERVTIDWYVIEDAQATNAFDAIQTGEHVKPVMQKVFLAAVDNDAIRDYALLANSAHVHMRFSEIECFSVMRACARGRSGPVLIIDLGASATKMYLSNERHIITATHVVPFGGQEFSAGIMKELGNDFAQAEKSKRELGLLALDGNVPDSARIFKVLSAGLDKICVDVKRVLSDNGLNEGATAHIVLTGGGARMPGIATYMQTHLQREIAIASPFDEAQGPFVLEEMLREVGPKFAGAMGVALRALV